MTKSKNSFAQVHPIIVFWLGLLTGAIIVSLVFFYRTLNGGDFESSLFRYYFSTPKTYDLNYYSRDGLSGDAYDITSPQTITGPQH